jgi:rod shape-determining protein MreC
MDSFFSRYRNPLVLIAVVLAQVLALAMQVQRPAQGFGTDTPDSAENSLARRWVTATVTPIERILLGSTHGVRSIWSNYIYLRHTREEDAQLKQELTRLREEEASFSEDAAQGRRLQKLLDFKQQYITTTVAAQVIGTSGTDRSRLILIDKGAVDGLKAEQAVITPDGIVGKLRDVFPHSAQVLLLSDPTSGAGVILASTRIRGILRGTSDGSVQINNLTADSRIKTGEQVITSGGDMVFPRGIPVGVIQSISPDPQHQPYTAIVIKPSANLTELEEVLVITGTQSNLSPAAQQLAGEQKRAADLIAEKLPSVQQSDDPQKVDPNDPSQQQIIGGQPGYPNSGMPRTRPALHTDRYSPNTTAPAADLTPGAPAAANQVYTQQPAQRRPAQTEQPKEAQPIQTLPQELPQ